MAKRTCSAAECFRDAVARGLCQRDYLIARRDGTLPPREMPTGIHSLSNVDREARLADCSICGPQVPVKFVRRGPQCKAKARETRRAWVYNLTAAEYDALLSRQSGQCAICKSEGPLLVDHDHTTGVVRGLLCHQCNITLGWLKDSAELALNSARYLQQFN